MNLQKIILVLLITLNINLSASVDTGKKLYLKANCQSCHNQGIEFNSMNNKVKNLKDLDKWIVGCGIKFDANWEDQDELVVGQYLNNIYYELKK